MHRRMMRSLVTALLLALIVVGCVTEDLAGPDDPTDPGEDLDAADISPTPDPPDPADAVTLFATPALARGCVATAALGGHPAWLFFTRPDAPCAGAAGSGKDRNAVRELTRLIASVPPGGRIDGHIFSITVDSVAKALYDAQVHGVDVRISTDGAVGHSKDYSKTGYLDRLDHIVYCHGADNRSCIGTADKAISHTKLFVFSRATAPDGTASDDVSWFGSANETYASGEKLYNNTVTIYGDAKLYAGFRDYLDDLYHQRRAADYYEPSTGRGHILAASADVYISPELETDLVTHRLDDVKPTSSCRVRVLQHELLDSRLPVVDRLVDMKRGGCKVWVATAKVGSEALARLHAAGIPVHHKPIHDKSFLIYGDFGGSYQYRVYSGSENLSSSAAHRYDEIFVKLAAETGDTHPIYDAFKAHFDDAYGDGTSL